MNGPGQRDAGRLGAAVLAGGLLVLGAGALLERSAGPVLTRLEGLFLDSAFRFRQRHGRPPPRDSRLAPVYIEEASIARFGRWPWRRSVHADILRKATPLRPRGVLFDVLFRGRTEDAEDRAFAEGVEELGNVGLAVGVAVTGERSERLRRDRVFGDLEDLVKRLSPPRPGYPAPEEWVRSLEPPLGDFVKGAAGLGHILSRPDPDGVYRRFHPFLVVDDRLIPSLSIVGLCMALRMPLDNVSVEGDELVLSPGGELTEERRYPLAPDGSMLINWSAPYGEGWDAVRMYELGGDRTDSLEKRAADKLWILGVSGLDRDMGWSPLSDQEIPLSETHLQAISSMLTGAVIREESGPLWLVAGVLLWLLMVLPALRLGSVTAALVGFLPLVLYAGGAFLLFARSSVLVPFVRPLLFGVGSWLGLLGWIVFVQEWARRRARERLGRYFPGGVIEQVMAGDEGPRLGGKRAELTILFSDIKGFTTTSEKIEPDVLGKFLGEYFDQMVAIVFAHGGTVDKFIGDGLMAFWGDPVPQEDHAARAVWAAKEMQAAAAALSEEWADRLDGPFQIRVGVNTGTVTVGNMGGRERMEYTVLGRSVNQAARLESNAEPGKILIGERTRNLLPDDMEVGARTMIRVKGIDHEIPVFTVEP